MVAHPDLPLLVDVLLAALVVLGAFFAFVGSFGMLKLGDFLKRLHGPTKASTLGVGCVLIASIAYFFARGDGLSVHELLITLFVFLSAPVSAHMLARAALRLTPAIRPTQPTDPPPELTADIRSEALPNSGGSTAAGSS